MTVIALTSSRGSPGVTSLAVGLALSLARKKADPLLIEADPAGGVLGLRFDLQREPSMATLAGEAGRGTGDDTLLNAHCVDLGGIQVLAAPFDGLIATWALNRSTSYLLEALPGSNRPVVIDLGRMDAASPALGLVAAADAVVTVCRASAEDAQAMMFGVRTLRNHAERVGLVTIGEKPFIPHEIADLASVPLFAVLPDDRRASKPLVGGKHSASTFRRSLLWRSVDSLAEGLFGTAWGDDRRHRDGPVGQQGEPFSRPAPTGMPISPPPGGPVPQPPQGSSGVPAEAQVSGES